MTNLDEVYPPERQVEHERHLVDVAAGVRCGYCLEELTDLSDVVPLDPYGEQHEGVMAHCACSALWLEDQAMEAESDRRHAWMR